MIRINHISICGRVAISLLLILGIFNFLSLPVWAENNCEQECQSPLTEENHTPDPGLEASKCPEPVPDFCACPRFGCDSLLVYFTDHSVGYIDTWEWDFGDPASGADNYSNEENPTHWYRTPGIYSVTLTVTGPGGTASITKSDYIILSVAPTADFDYTVRPGCNSSTVSFKDLSIDAYTWYWDFGDGTRSFEQNPTHTYYAEGTYRVTLVVSNGCGQDRIKKYIEITLGHGPKADFTSDATEGCEDTQINFTDLSTGAETWSWDFGDGSASTDQNPSHTYTSAGTFTVRLTVTNDCGDDEAIKAEYITIHPKPVADFTADMTEICEEWTVKFTDLSSHADSWHWEFGDGTTSDERHPEHKYSGAGTYTVSLTVTNDCGDDTESREKYITVVAEPVADFTSDVTEACEGAAVSFTDLSLYADSWSWEFGDGATSNDQNPPHQYTAAGVYTVKLTVSNKCGDDDTVKTEYITIHPKPVADFTADMTEICEKGTVNFTDLSSYAETWFWEFGDGATSDEQNPSHEYTAAGVYTVKLTVTNDCGRDDKNRENYITVVAEPVADFTSDVTEGCEGTTVNFTDLSSYATSWSWEFGDGATLNDQNPSHEYTAPGVYTVKLTVSNECGDDDKVKTEYITIRPKPVADFTADATERCTGETVNFTDLSTHAASWQWDFGDGTGASVPNPSHEYAAAGKYTVSLKVTNDCGDDTETKTDYVIVHEGPKSDFSATPTSGIVPLTVSFTDLSTSDHGINSWAWDFGDGGTSIQQNPIYTYSSAGTYTVKLKVIDDCGDDVAVKTEYIYVTDTCSIDFAGEPTEGCAELTVSFTGKSTGPCEIGSWTWDFGDTASGSDNVASGQNVEHIYKLPGKYTVTLTAVDISGTKSVTKTEYVTVNGPPSAAFDADPAEGIAPLMVSFTDQSVSAIGINSHEWNFGDPASGADNVSTLPNPVHVFNAQGVYEVSLIVANDCGEDTAFVDITVSPAISVIKEVDKANASVGEELLYTLKLQNNSPEVIHNIMVMDTVPDSTGLIDGSITGGGKYDAVHNIVSWDITSLDAGAEVEVSFRVLLDGPFTQFPTIVSNQGFAIINDVDARAAASRTFVSNIVTTTVGPPTGTLGLSKEVSATLASPGDLLTYTITVNNNNPATAFNVIILDAIPDSTVYVSGSVTGGGIYDPATDSLIWNLGALDPLETRAVSFQVTIKSDVGDGITIPNTALVRSSLGSNESNQVTTAVSLTPIVITKTAGTPSGLIGDLIRFTITIENYTAEPFTDVQLVDTMPGGIFYVAGTSVLNGTIIADPTGENPLEWSLGDLPGSGTMKVEYIALIGASAHPGMNENIARSRAFQGGVLVHSNRALAQIFVLGYNLTGSIRGKVIVDCDGDGVPDMDSVPVGMDIYLDDGSQSRVNKEGMFYFSTVRAGEHAVLLDERDMEGYYIPEGAQASVFVHVHETGESYVIFRICPEYPILDISKEASIVPVVKVTKKAKLNPDRKKDSLGALIDYKIDIRTNGYTDPTQVRVVDSIPENTRLIFADGEPLRPEQTGNQLVYDVSAAQERLRKTMSYSLRDMSPGSRRFLTNKIHLEGDEIKAGEQARLVVSTPADVAVGPLLLAPPQDVKIILTPALFITSKADLQTPAFPQLEAVADSIEKYADADIKVDGHTDYRRIHTIQFPSNWELGEARALAVVNWLVDNKEIERDRLAYESFAATRPIVLTGTTSEELQPNRRTEVTIQSKFPGFLAPDIDPAKEWENSTSLTLNPVRFDSLFESTADPIEIGLDGLWEVVLKIENTSSMIAENVIVSDILPEGVEYVAGSAVIDGSGVSAAISGKMLNLELGRIEASQKLELRYRVRALPDQTPTGGGAASVEVKTVNDLPVIKNSNEVRFK